MIPVMYDELDRIGKRKVRERYIRDQKGLCHYCGKPLDGPPSKKVEKAYIRNRLYPKTFFDFPVHLHHSHETGLTIGAVHARCNAYLWEYEGE